MKRFCLILACLTTYLVSSYAQTEIKRDSTLINLENRLPESSSHIEAKHEFETVESVQTLDPEELKRRAEFVKTLQFKTPEFYVGPPTQNETLTEKLPFTNDYAFSGYTELGNNFYLHSSSAQNTYMTIGTNRIANISLNYQATDWLEIAGGMYTAKYNAYFRNYNDAGFNAAFRVKLHDRIYLRGYGNYSINTNDRNRYLGPAGMGMFPKTHFGGGVEFKITESIGVEGGMVREFDQVKRKWNNIPYIMPVVYSIGGRR